MTGFAGVTLGWQMTWAYGSNSKHGGFANYHNNQMEMYQAIVNAVKTMVVMTGIDLVIPSATAIQNLRGTPVNNPPLDLTRDGSHIDLGAGRYTLACTWFQSLIAPCLGITIAEEPVFSEMKLSQDEIDEIEWRMAVLNLPEIQI